MIEMILSQSYTSRPGNTEIIGYDRNLHRSLIPEVYSRGFSDDPWKSDWDEFECFDEKGTFLAVEGKEVVGFVISHERDGNGYISVLSVLPEFRRRGIAGDLISRAIAFLQGRNLPEITLHVEKENRAARELYSKLGFFEEFSFAADSPVMAHGTRRP
ncbi:MAG: GNAT family N-acetyltransferase [Spirochaetales bacterium]|nr:GNAT family N-acetyltransferase [Spirochaetales bacterium]